MSHYCKRWKALHLKDELCPHHRKQLKENPAILAEAANFTNIAGQYYLTTSQALDKVAQGVNKLAGTNLRFEGSHQYIRDVQVFNQLNADAYSITQPFTSPEKAKAFFEDPTVKNRISTLTKKLSGTGQEVDWVRYKEGKLSSLFQQSELLDGNAPGVDGVTINRFTGEELSRTSIKAAQSTNNLNRNINDVLEALEAETLKPNDVVAGIDGTKDKLTSALEENIKIAQNAGDTDYANKLKQAHEQLKVEKLNNTKHVKESTNRLKEKIFDDQAHSSVTLKEVSKKAAQGAVIGAVVGLTVSGLTNYMKYKNGEITEKEAFQAVGQDTLKGSLIGGTMATVTIFIPGGTVGFIAGMAIGIYLNKSLTNILDEVFGNGAYLEILHASGFVFGMATSLEESIKKIAKDETKVKSHAKKINKLSTNIKKNFAEFSAIMKGDL